MGLLIPGTANAINSAFVQALSDSGRIGYGLMGQADIAAILDAGPATSMNVLPSQMGQAGHFLTTDGNGNVSWAVVNALPSQSGQSGKYLTTDGSVASWATGTGGIPSQTGQAGNFLTTDGSAASWAQVLAAQTGQSGKYLTTNGSTTSWVNISGSLPSGGTSGQLLVAGGGGTGGWSSTSALPFTFSVGASTRIYDIRNPIFAGGAKPWAPVNNFPDSSYDAWPAFEAAFEAMSTTSTTWLSGSPTAALYVPGNAGAWWISRPLCFPAYCQMFGDSDLTSQICASIGSQQYPQFLQGFAGPMIYLGRQVGPLTIEYVADPFGNPVVPSGTSKALVLDASGTTSTNYLPLHDAYAWNSYNDTGVWTQFSLQYWVKVNGGVLPGGDGDNCSVIGCRGGQVGNIPGHVAFGHYFIQSGSTVNGYLFFQGTGASFVLPDGNWHNYEINWGGPLQGKITLSGATGVVGANINGTIVTVTASGGDTATATALKNAINADGALTGIVTATSALGVVTITSVASPATIYLLAVGTGVTSSTAYLTASEVWYYLDGVCLNPGGTAITFDGPMILYPWEGVSIGRGGLENGADWDTINGAISSVRLSNQVRHTGASSFTPPTNPYAWDDPSTMALLNWDQGAANSYEPFVIGQCRQRPFDYAGNYVPHFIRTTSTSSYDVQLRNLYIAGSGNQSGIINYNGAFLELDHIYVIGMTKYGISSFDGGSFYTSAHYITASADSIPVLLALELGGNNFVLSGQIGGWFVDGKFDQAEIQPGSGYYFRSQGGSGGAYTGFIFGGSGYGEFSSLEVSGTGADTEGEFPLWQAGVILKSVQSFYSHSNGYASFGAGRTPNNPPFLVEEMPSGPSCVFQNDEFFANNGTPSAFGFVSGYAVNTNSTIDARDCFWNQLTNGVPWAPTGYESFVTLRYPQSLTNQLSLDSQLGSGLTITSHVTDGASAVGITLNQTGALSTAGSKLLSLQNNTVEKAFVGYDGTVESSTYGAGFVLKSPNGTRYRIVVANDGTLSTTLA